MKCQWISDLFGLLIVKISNSKFRILILLFLKNNYKSEPFIFTNKNYTKSGFVASILEIEIKKDEIERSKDGTKNYWYRKNLKDEWRILPIEMYECFVTSRHLSSLNRHFAHSFYWRALLHFVTRQKYLKHRKGDFMEEKKKLEKETKNKRKSEDK